MNRFPNLTLAYQALLRDLVANGLRVGSTVELIGYSFSVDLPHDRAIFLPSRRIDLPFAVSSAIWTMTGTSDFKQIDLCLKDTQITGDRTELYCGYGKRLLNLDGLNQIAAVIDCLKKDPYSRRAVAVIYLPSDNQMSSGGSARIPCPIGIQFLVREGRLHGVGYMRSQSAAIILPYDVFTITFLQEIVAVELGLDLGPYHHVCGSLHYYLEEEPLVQQIIAEKDRGFTSYESVPLMPREVRPFEMLDMIASIDAIKNQVINPAQLESFQLPDVPQYWQDLTLIMLSRIAENSGVETSKYTSQLPNYYRRHFHCDRRPE